MSLFGELTDLQVSDLLELLVYRGKTGTLAVRAIDEDFSFTLTNGKLTEITSSTLAIRLGKSLVRVGLLTVEDLRTALFALDQQPGRCTLCRLLVEREFLQETAIAPHLEEQYVETLARAMACGNGSFHFHPGSSGKTNRLAAGFDTTRMLQSANRQLVDMQSVGEYLIPAASAV